LILHDNAGPLGTSALHAANMSLAALAQSTMEHQPRRRDRRLLDGRRFGSIQRLGMAIACCWMARTKANVQLLGDGLVVNQP